MSQSVVEPYRTPPTGYRAAVSLHAHTDHSRESLGFLPDWLDGVPVVRRLWQREQARRSSGARGPFDLSRGYWRPPMSPRGVLHSETGQIHDRLGLEAIVSLTDHDTFGAPMALRAVAGEAAVPLSVEWSVRHGGSRFHLGVHNVPADIVLACGAALAAETAQPGAGGLADLLELLASCPSALIVFNHPLWDGEVNHALDAQEASEFLRRYGRWIHAIELNGYRKWPENQRAMALAECWRLPLVAGGDRHGRAPNAVLNLSHAASFDEFACEVRDDRRSHLLVMPEYFGQPAARELAALSEILGTDRGLARGHRHWSERVFVTDGRGADHPLAEAWDGGIPWWVSSLVGVLRLAGSAPARPLLRAALAGGQLSLF